MLSPYGGSALRYGSAGSAFKVAVTAGLLALKSGDKRPFVEDHKAGITIFAGAAGAASLAAIAHNTQYFANGLFVKPFHHKFSHHKPTRTRSSAKPTKTQHFASGATGKPRNAVFALSICVLVAGGQAAMVLGQCSSFSSGGDGEDGNGSQSISSSDGNSVNGSGGDSSAPDGATGDPSGIKLSDISLKGLDKGFGGGSPPPPPPPSHTTSGSGDGNNGRKVYGLDWRALIVAATVVAALKKFKVQDMLKAGEQDVGHVDVQPVQGVFGFQNQTVGYIRDVVGAGLLDNTSRLTVSSSTHSVFGHHTDLITTTNDKDKKLALIYDFANFNNTHHLFGHVEMCAGEVGTNLILFEHTDDSPYVTVFPQATIEQVVTLGTGIIDNSSVRRWLSNHTRKMRNFITFILTIVCHLLANILLGVVEHLNATMKKWDDEEAAAAAAANNNTVNESFSHKQSESKTSQHKTTASSNAVLVKEVAKRAAIKRPLWLRSDIEGSVPAIEDYFATEILAVEEVYGLEIIVDGITTQKSIVEDTKDTVEDVVEDTIEDVVEDNQDTIEDAIEDIVKDNKGTLVVQAASMVACISLPAISDSDITKEISSSKSFPPNVNVISVNTVTETDSSVATTTTTATTSTTTTTTTIEEASEIPQLYAIPVVGEERARRRRRRGHGGRRNNIRAGHGQGGRAANGSSL
ncbi:hypothetical protein BDN70DRAFT_719398 [Pholiota conissans]|uniref:Uncharacterized protein n=1 Tax=Pholiota conissans TaxID=109636 RepID=A0A9P5Z2K3_9AGAR|nr:hypothetical protein BDN70DRAFT_719398 [Pholiota conissans]